MISKELTVSFRILIDIALLRRLPKNHQAIPIIEQDLAKRLKGYRGEKNLKYFLGMLPEDSCRIFYDIRLKYGDYFFQIDTLIIFPTFILIIEVKNISGTLYFDNNSSQFSRTYQNKEENFSNPIYQVKRHKNFLEKYLAQYGLPSIPIEYLVVVSDSTTQIRADRVNSNIFQTVIHAERIFEKLEEFNNIHTKKFHTKLLDKVESTLLNGHIEDIPDIHSNFKIKKESIIKGVLCQNCKSNNVTRHQGYWHCENCRTKDKYWHVHSLLDYLLLINPSITNQECRNFLLLSNSRIAKYLLTSMGLAKVGKCKGTVYHRPPIEYFIKYFQPIIDEIKLYEKSL